MPSIPSKCAARCLTMRAVFSFLALRTTSTEPAGGPWMKAAAVARSRCPLRSSSCVSMKSRKSMESVCVSLPNVATRRSWPSRNESTVGSTRMATLRDLHRASCSFMWIRPNRTPTPAPEGSRLWTTFSQALANPMEALCHSAYTCTTHSVPGSEPRTKVSKFSAVSSSASDGKGLKLISSASYIFLRFSSDRTAYASEMRCMSPSHSAQLGFLSGWYFMASLR
mmetsp:Transcript_33857/g.65899  ORF Transcript_33857/g.65899 Transcript_33857/m.65899 type:complete len:224 (-) Transcript_33857:895-1566(-)